MRWFVGKRVKARLPATGAAGQPTFEHLWVRVTAVVGTRLQGKLDEEPALQMRAKRGSHVTVERRNVEAVVEDAA